MDRDEFQSVLRKQPFQPFRVIVDDGRTYEVRYPNMNLLATKYVVIGIPEPRPTPKCHHTEYVRLAQILRVEPLPVMDASLPS